MNRTGGLLLALVLAGCAAGAPAGSGPSSAVPIRIAAAADLRYALDELIASWKAADSRRAARATYGSSGNFVAQIKSGAPFDVFFSADAAYPRELETAGLAEPGSTRIYGIGQLVVWVRADSPVDVESRGLAALLDPAVRSVAIANPEHAPYGRAAVAAMKAARIYEELESRLVLGENVSQAAQFVETGNADAGVFALSLALAAPLRAQGRYAIVPIETYPRLEQGALVLGTAINPAEARAFLDFVLGPEGRPVLDRYGFLRSPS